MGQIAEDIDQNKLYSEEIDKQIFDLNDNIKKMKSENKDIRLNNLEKDKQVVIFDKELTQIVKSVND